MRTFIMFFVVLGVVAGCLLFPHVGHRVLVHALSLLAGILVLFAVVYVLVASGAVLEHMDEIAAIQKRLVALEKRPTPPNIQKIEIVVTSDQEPSRVARVVQDKLLAHSRDPGPKTAA